MSSEPHSQQADGPSRIELLSAELADQIAAGEVVERPASVVKELVENAIDAGATRVEVELQGAGLERIAVRDDGAGVHPEDLTLCIKRHATSKVRRPSDLIEVATLGFRGEALASVAAVADLTIESRTATAKTGTRLRSRPGLPPELEPVGIAPGTRVEVRALFGNVPARRKFMRSEATEVGHCSDTMLRLAISNPGVHLRLAHGSRELLDLPGAVLPRRVAMILERKTQAKLHRLDAEHDGTQVCAFLGPPDAATRTRGGLFIVVRRRVVTERTISQIVHAAYGDAVPRGRHPVGALLIEPPPATVDVNVHPQKAEVRFSDPQRVYSAVRRTLEEFEPSPGAEVGSVRSFAPASAVADRWQGRAAQAQPVPAAEPRRPAESYRLRTRATDHDYASHRTELRAEAERLRDEPTANPAAARRQQARQEAREVTEAVEPTETPEPVGPSVTLLTCLPGPVAIMRVDDDLLAVDLLRLRSHLVYRRLQADLGGAGKVVAQGLLSPVVVHCSAEDRALCVESEDALAEVGLSVEAFGEDALLVRAVPAGLRHCVDEPDVEDLVARILPWLRVRASADADRSSEDALMALAGTKGIDPAPRLARRWIRELLTEGAELSEVPGVARYRPEDLVR